MSANIGCGLHITGTWLLWQKLAGLQFSDVTRCLEVDRSGQVQLLEEVIMDPGSWSAPPPSSFASEFYP